MSRFGRIGSALAVVAVLVLGVTSCGGESDGGEAVSFSCENGSLSFAIGMENAAKARVSGGVTESAAGARMARVYSDWQSACADEPDSGAAYSAGIRAVAKRAADADDTLKPIMEALAGDLCNNATGTLTPSAKRTCDGIASK